MTFFFYTTLLIALAYPIFLLWCRLGWSRLPEIKTAPSDERTKPPFVSIIVPARNEEENIGNTLKALRRQQYPRERYEVLIVDDNSEDNTTAIVKDLQQEEPNGNIRLIELSTTSPSKKHAITEGVRAAKGELILITDADCTLTANALNIISSQYVHCSPHLLCGPVTIAPVKGTVFLNLFRQLQALEQAGLSVITGGAIANGQPVICNGANLAFPKNIFESVDGYEGDGFASGDDTSLMKRIAKQDSASIQYVKAYDSRAVTHPITSLEELYNQRRRWASKVRHMNSLAILIALAAFLYHALLLCLVPLTLMGMGGPWLLMLLGIKMASEFTVIQAGTSFFRNNKLLWLFLPAQVIYPFYIIIVGFSSQFSRYKWKGRIAS